MSLPPDSLAARAAEARALAGPPLRGVGRTNIRVSYYVALALLIAIVLTIASCSQPHLTG